jgi:hypothetical protein
VLRAGYLDESFLLPA